MDFDFTSAIVSSLKKQFSFELISMERAIEFLIKTQKKNTKKNLFNSFNEFGFNVRGMDSEIITQSNIIMMMFVT